MVNSDIFARPLFSVSIDPHGYEFCTIWYRRDALGGKAKRNAVIVKQVLDGSSLVKVAQENGLKGPERVRQIMNCFCRRAIPSIAWSKLSRRNGSNFTKVARMHRGWLLRALKSYTATESEQ